MAKFNQTTTTNLSSDRMIFTIITILKKRKSFADDEKEATYLMRVMKKKQVSKP